MTSVVLLPSAREDLRHALLWYREQRAGLDREFRGELDRVLANIADNSSIYPIAYKSVRRAITRRFPYKIFYETRGAQTLVLAIRRHSQRPLPDLERT